MTRWEANRGDNTFSPCRLCPFLFAVFILSFHLVCVLPPPLHALAYHILCTATAHTMAAYASRIWPFSTTLSPPFAIVTCRGFHCCIKHVRVSRLSANRCCLPSADVGFSSCGLKWRAGVTARGLLKAIPIAHEGIYTTESKVKINRQVPQ